MNQSKEIFFSDLIDGYYAECDEHLARVRRALLSVETTLQKDHIDRRPLDELFRSFHTIKGLSGMVGLREAEQLAHHLETLLRSLIEGLAPLTSDELDTLLASTKLIEQVIAAHRSKKSMPDLAPVMARLAENTSRMNPPGDITSRGAPRASKQMLDAERVKRLEEAVKKGARLWRFEFTPDPSLAGRGITVNSIRGKILEMGEIVNAFPEVTAEERIKFVFIVASFKDESSFAAFLEEGVTYGPYVLPAGMHDRGEESAEAFFHTPSVAEAEEIDTGEGERRLRSLTPAHIVRVDLARLDRLIEMLSSLVISRAHLEHNLQRIESMVPSLHLRPLQDAGVAIERQLRELREGIMGLRMVPIRNVFEFMRFAVHDLCREMRKKVAVETRGEETEIDKYVVERMMDPLLHIVRNAVSHGIEPQDDRVAAGKPLEGVLKLNASTSGDLVVIEVEDDGRGIDPELVLKKAKSQGPAAPAEDLGNKALLDILSEAGFTTLPQADITSGRGVGMAIVRKTVQEMGGTIALDTRVGEGSRFTIRLPMTLAVLNAAIVSVGGQTFALPVSSIREVVEVHPGDVTVFENNEMIKYREGVLLLVRLAGLFGLKETCTRAFYAVVVGTDSRSSALAVDRLLGQREIVVRALADPLLRVPGVSGATELGDGRAVLILDPTALLRSGRIGR